MSKVVKSVFGGGGSTGMLGTGRFQASTRDIDKDAFKIEGSKEAAKRAREREKESVDRSKRAQGQRQELIGQLQGQAAGTAPSLAEAQLKSASERNLAQQLAAAQSQRGGSAALRERQLMRGQAQSGRQLAQDAATARLQERNQAQALLGQQIGQEQALADQLIQNYLQQGFSIEKARQQAKADYEAMATGQYMQAQGINAQAFEGAAGRRGQLASDIMGGASSAMMMFSDKNTKKKVKKSSDNDIKNALNSTSSNDSKIKSKYTEVKAAEIPKIKTSKKEDSKMNVELISKAMPKLMTALSDDSTKMKKKTDIKKDFLDKLEAYTYEYKDKFKKDPRAGEGRHMSVMAQDLEKAGPIGESMVEENEEGVKTVNYAKGYGAILAAQAHLNKRLDELEKKKSKKRK